MWWRDPDRLDYAELITDPSSARLMGTAAAFGVQPVTIDAGYEALSEAIGSDPVVSAFHAAGDDDAYSLWASDAVDTWGATASALRARGLPEALAAQRAVLVFGTTSVDPAYLEVAALPSADADLLTAVADQVLAGQLSQLVVDPVGKADEWDESEVRRDPKGRFTEEGGTRTITRDVGGHSEAISEGEAVAEDVSEARAPEKVATKQSSAEQLAALVSSKEAARQKLATRRKRLKRVQSAQQATREARAARAAEAAEVRNALKTAVSQRTSANEKVSSRAQERDAIKLRMGRELRHAPRIGPKGEQRPRVMVSPAEIGANFLFGAVSSSEPTGSVPPGKAKLNDNPIPESVSPHILVDKDGYAADITDLLVKPIDLAWRITRDPAFMAYKTAAVDEALRGYNAALSGTLATARADALGYVTAEDYLVLVSPVILNEMTDDIVHTVSSESMRGATFTKTLTNLNMMRYDGQWLTGDLEVTTRSPDVNQPTVIELTPVFSKSDDWDESEVRRDARGRFSFETGEREVEGSLVAVSEPSTAQVSDSSATVARVSRSSADRAAYLNRRNRVLRTQRAQGANRAAAATAQRQEINAARTQALEERNARRSEVVTTDTKTSESTSVKLRLARQLRSVSAVASDTQSAASTKRATSAPATEPSSESASVRAGSPGVKFRSDAGIGRRLATLRSSLLKQSPDTESGSLLPKIVFDLSWTQGTTTKGADPSDAVFIDLDSARRFVAVRKLMLGDPTLRYSMSLDGVGTSSFPFIIDELVDVTDDPDHAVNRIIKSAPLARLERRR